MNKIEQCTCLERVATFDKRDDMSTHRCPIHKQLSTKIGVISPQTSQTNLETTLKRNLHFPTDLLDRYLLPATSLSLSLSSADPPPGGACFRTWWNIRARPADTSGATRRQWVPHRRAATGAGDRRGGRLRGMKSLIFHARPTPLGTMLIHVDPGEQGQAPRVRHLLRMGHNKPLSFGLMKWFVAAEVSRPNC